jgi:cell division protein FtsX
MGPIAKMFIGVLLMVGSVVAVIASIGTQFDLLKALITVVLGVVPALVFLIGVFIVWLEWDELKIERELAKEEEEEKKKAKKKKK